jgi:hypothetical protein
VARQGFFAFDLSRDEPAVLDRYEVVCASGVVEVLPDYNAALGRLFRCRAPSVLVLRQSITTDPTRIERWDAYGRPTFRVFLNRREFEREVAGAGRKIVREVAIDEIVRGFVLSHQ